MRRFVLPLSLLVLLGAGCLSLESDTAATPENETQEVADQTVQADAPTKSSRTPTENEPPSAQPNVQQGGSIQDHALFIAFSDNGKDWDVNKETIAEAGSVGDLMVLTQDAGNYEAGDLLAYFVDASDMEKAGDERIALISSADGGKTWSERQQIAIDGLSDAILAVDPSAVQLDDGSIRIFFFDFSKIGGIAQEDWDEEQDHVIYSAISIDGETFDFEGESFRRANVTDPEVVKFGDTWFMYLAAVSEEGIAVATSTDGQSFEDTGVVIDMMGIPGSLLVDGEVHVYGCDNGISRVTSNDGITFSDSEVVLQVPACDPDPAELEDGSIALLIKGFTTTLTMPPTR